MRREEEGGGRIKRGEGRGRGEGEKEGGRRGRERREGRRTETETQFTVILYISITCPLGSHEVHDSHMTTSEATQQPS